MSSADRFCTKCGARIPAGAGFCPNCGTPAPSQQAAPPYGPAYGNRARRYEKQEKHEKHEKGEKNEKGRGGDITGALTGGLILIWLGLSFFLQQNGYFSSGNWWAYFLIGIGVILILQGLLRYGMNRMPFVGSFIGGIVLILIGLAFVQSFTATLWPLILVAIGVFVLLSAMFGRQRRPAP